MTKLQEQERELRKKYLESKKKIGVPDEISGLPDGYRTLAEIKYDFQVTFCPTDAQIESQSECLDLEHELFRKQAKLNMKGLPLLPIEKEDSKE